MEILKLLQQKSKYFYLLMAVFGLVNTMWNMGLLAILNVSVEKTTLPWIGDHTWQLFFGLVMLSLVSNKIFQNFMVRLTNDLSYQMGISVVEKIRFASYEDFEKLGKEKVYATLQDAQQISMVPRVFIESFNSLVIVICCFIYLTWLSPTGGLLLAGATVLIMVFFVYRNKKIEKELNVVRDLQNDYFAYMNDLLLGFREIKMGIDRNDNLLHRFLDKNRRITRDIITVNQYKYVNNDLVGSYSLYIIIGIVLFVLPLIYPDDLSMGSLMIAILYAVGPITSLINLIPTYTRLKIAIERVNAFDQQMDTLIKGRIRHGHPLTASEGFHSLRLEEVTYRYEDKNKQQSFMLGPVSLEIRKGELIFVTGGNGSGKSTFINVLTGIYQPTSGKIFLNEEEITLENYPQYRNYISAIFTDNYLFSENYDGFDLRLINSHFQDYVQAMKLADIIRYDSDKNKVEHSLSKGQSKRLALIFTQLENRDVCVLDEWAAEQDPLFRKYFYTHMLQQLQHQGKTVIVITHDDAYFHCAERLITFDYGKIIRDEYVGLTENTPSVAAVPDTHD